MVDRSSNVAIWKWSLLGNTFGANAPDEDPDGNGNAFEMNLRFPGQYYDAETGLNYNYFRDYEAATGRYIQSDPIGTYGGFATYSYSAQNPTASFDRYGLCWSNARAVAHFYAGGGDVSTDTIGCTTQLTDRIDPARSAWEALTRSAAESKARAIKCGTSSTFKNNRSVAVSSGIFWIGGFSLLQDANCVVSKTCGSNGEIACTPDSYSYDCLLAHKMHDLFVNPTDFDNSNSDFWDNWNYGGSPFYVDGFWDDRISGGGVLL